MKSVISYRIIDFNTSVLRGGSGLYQWYCQYKESSIRLIDFTEYLFESVISNLGDRSIGLQGRHFFKHSVAIAGYID